MFGFRNVISGKTTERFTVCKHGNLRILYCLPANLLPILIYHAAASILYKRKSLLRGLKHLHKGLCHQIINARANK